MSFRLPTRAARTQTRTRWSGTAFLVEAMALIVFLMIAFAILTQLFAVSLERSRQGEELAQAVALASDVAERFSADPQHSPAEQAEGDLRARCEVTTQERAGGVLYRADIAVYLADDLRTPGDDEPVYELDTAVYVGEGGAR